jgi:hypothetical protein
VAQAAAAYPAPGRTSSARARRLPFPSPPTKVTSCRLLFAQRTSELFVELNQGMPPLLGGACSKYRSRGTRTLIDINVTPAFNRACPLALSAEACFVVLTVESTLIR